MRHRAHDENTFDASRGAGGEAGSGGESERVDDCPGRVEPAFVLASPGRVGYLDGESSAVLPEEVDAEAVVLDDTVHE